MKWGLRTVFYKSLKNKRICYSVEIFTAVEPARLVCVCGITILVILFHANTLINFQFGSAAAVLYFLMSSLKKYKSEFLSHSEAKNSAWERPGFEQQNPGKLEPRCVRGAEVGSWHSSWLSQIHDVVLHTSFTCLQKVKWRTPFPLCGFIKHLE